jgi:hypothetical protein
MLYRNPEDTIHCVGTDQPTLVMGLPRIETDQGDPTDAEDRFYVAIQQSVIDEDDDANSIYHIGEFPYSYYVHGDGFVYIRSNQLSQCMKFHSIISNRMDGYDIVAQVPINCNAPETISWVNDMTRDTMYDGRGNLVNHFDIRLTDRRNNIIDLHGLDWTCVVALLFKTLLISFPMNPMTNHLFE